VHWFGPRSFTADLNAYAAFRFPAERMFRQAETIFRYLGSHPEDRMDDTVLNQATVYRRSGRGAEAEQVLRNALAEQEELQRALPQDPVPFSDAGRILSLLGERSAAAAALEAAAGLDIARLPGALGGSGEWAVRWSLGKTYHAMGYRDDAREEIAHAEALAPDDDTRSRIRRWLSWEERRLKLLDPDDGRGSGPV
jgi:tetratricopeptide (TPR) repeat protein